MSSIEQTELKRQRILRRERVSSVMVAVLVHALIIVGLAVWKLAGDEPVKVPIQITEKKVAKEKPDRDRPTSDAISQRLPGGAPANDLIATITHSDTIAPAVTVNVSSLDIGASESLGIGVGMGDFGVGDKGGVDQPFGSDQQSGSSLVGRLYDFKQNAEGQAVRYDVRKREDFVRRVKRLQSARFSDQSLKRYYKAPKELFLSTLAVPFSPASEGPGYFGAADKIKPSGWFAHYSGQVAAPEDGMYRFVGIGDDYLSVYLRNKPVLVAAWPDIQSELKGRFKSTKPTGDFQSPMDVPLVYGEWIRLRAGQPLPIDIAIGERPGGKVGFLLMVEKKGESYRTTPAGRAILPLFTTEVIGAKQRERIRNDFPGFEFEWDNVPVFTASEDDGFGL